ncbi:helix-turn-helix domain-containing protein [Brachybacterium sp. ACRRE]|uniref:helix-turn-helix domain-containing protein n=1 Tax=Brachybacterium sp. ACRRE TaxID=2918184 RepID=UPI001EF1A240|nr:helix-turn-helix domain-containing protein [Brachybacterium sp. ACRRE]MCG7310980.1 helix-turn-helix domain-containing protein [Brachybacterium sp. ACRRE]
MDRLARSVIDLNGVVQQITGAPAEQRPLGHARSSIAREHGISRSTLYRYLEQPELPL